jgi:hypothetical protein
MDIDLDDLEDGPLAGERPDAATTLAVNCELLLAPGPCWAADVVAPLLAGMPHLAPPPPRAARREAD